MGLKPISQLRKLRLREIKELVQGQIFTGWGWLAPKPDEPATPRPRGKAEGFPAADESLGLDPAQARVQQFPPPTERKRGVLCAPQHPETPGKLASEHKALCDLS